MKLINDNDGILCSEFSKDLNAPPIGTAIHTENIILIAASGEWPQRITQNETFNKLSQNILNLKNTKIFLYKPEKQNSFNILLFVTKGYKCGLKIFNNKSTNEQSERLAKIINNLSTLNIDNLEPLESPYILLCTHEQRDICCGQKGNSLITNLKFKYPNEKILAVSHLGGHRFAPTAITLPDRRMWAYLDDKSADIILNKSPIDKDLINKYRGWLGAQSGPEQIAEGLLFEQYGWNINDKQIQIDSKSQSDSTTQVSITLGGKKHTYKYKPTKKLPIIECLSQEKVSGFQQLYEPVDDYL